MRWRRLLRVLLKGLKMGSVGDCCIRHRIRDRILPSRRQLFSDPLLIRN